MIQLYRELVSIILPTYNGDRFLKQAIDSCLNQEKVNIELVIVDDGSGKSTKAIIAEYKDRDQVKVITHDRNKGLIASLNAGFRNASGQFLTWTSDDNYYLPDAILKMMTVLKEEDHVSFVYAGYKMHDHNDQFVSIGKTKDPLFLNDDNYIGPCFLYRRSVYEEIGDYNQDAFLVEDYEYWLRVREVFQMKRIAEDLYIYREHNDNLTAQHGIDQIHQQVVKFREKYISQDYHLYHLGRDAYHHHPKQAKQFFFAAIMRKPFTALYWRWLLKSLF